MSLTKVTYSMIEGPTVNVADFGAVGDGTTDDSSAIAAAVAATPSGAVLMFPEGTFLLDQEIFITQPMTIVGPGTIKLPDQSSLFHDSTNPYARKLFHVRSSDVHFQNLTFDMNSPNNWVIVGGIKYYFESQDTSPTDFNLVSSILIGFYGPQYNVPPSSAFNIENITVTNCKFFNSPMGFIETFIQPAYDPGGYYASEVRIENNYFYAGQNVQVAFNQTANSVVIGNTFVNCYFVSFQYYYWNENCQVSDNTFFYDRSTIDYALVDPRRYYTPGDPINCGDIRLGKDFDKPNYSCNFTNNSLQGVPILIGPSQINCACDNNTSFKSELFGILVIPAFSGNTVSGNRILASDQPALYLDNPEPGLPGTPAPCTIENNYIEGCCTKILSPDFIGRDLNSQVWIIDKYYNINKNTVRKGLSSVLYGMTFFNQAAATGISSFYGNITDTAGNTDNVIINNALLPETPVWILPNGSASLFSLWLKAGGSNVTGNGTVYNIPYDERVYDPTLVVNTSTGLFTCKQAGLYHFDASAYLLNIGGATSGYIKIVVNNGTNEEYFNYYTLNPSVTANQSFTISQDIAMQVNGTAKVAVLVTGIGADTADVSTTDFVSRFSGRLIY